MFRFNYLKKNMNSAIWKHQQFGSISRFRFNYIAHEPKKKAKKSQSYSSSEASAGTQQHILIFSELQQFGFCLL